MTSWDVDDLLGTEETLDRSEELGFRDVLAEVDLQSEDVADLDSETDIRALGSLDD